MNVMCVRLGKKVVGMDAWLHCFISASMSRATAVEEQVGQPPLEQLVRCGDSRATAFEHWSAEAILRGLQSSGQ